MRTSTRTWVLALVVGLLAVASFGSWSYSQAGALERTSAAATTEVAAGSGDDAPAVVGSNTNRRWHASLGDTRRLVFLEVAAIVAGLAVLGRGCWTRRLLLRTVPVGTTRTAPASAPPRAPPAFALPR